MSVLETTAATIHFITEVTCCDVTVLGVMSAAAYNRFETTFLNDKRIESLASSATATAVQSKVISRPSGHWLASAENRNTVLCLLLVLVTLAFYNPIAHNGFTNLDDDIYILDNAHVRAGLTWSTVKWAFTSFDAANWHPLTWLSHALDYQLFKLNPAGPHYVNVLLHSWSAVLLFLLLESATGWTWPALMVAGLFALHPVNVESVAWAAERKNVLSMLFFLLTMHAYQWYVRRGGGVKRYAAVAALFALGLMAKSEIITLPFVLLLWDYWPLERTPVLSSRFSVLSERPSESTGVSGAAVQRSFSFLVLEKVPLLLLSAGSGVLTMLAQRAGHAVRTLPASERWGNALVAYVRYLGKAFWPARLAVLYPHPGDSLPAWEIIAAAAVLFSITAVVFLLRERRYLVTGWLWFLGTLVPVIGIVSVGEQAMADRYAYLPYIGLFVCVVWGVAEIARERKIPAVWLVAPAVLILLTLGVLSRRQLAYWHDSETLWRHTLSVTERNYMAHGGLARALAKEGQTDAAIAEFNAAENLHTYAFSDMVVLGVYEQTHGHAQDAILQYGRAFGAAPDSNARAVALSSLGSAYLQAGDFERAETSYADALQQNPDTVAALVGSSLLAERDGDFTRAIASMSRAVKLEPSDVTYLLLSQAFRRAGRLAEAEDAGARAQRISHDFVQAQRSAAQILTAAGVTPE
jgi:protein O-mannosyl-transferase